MLRGMIALACFSSHYFVPEKAIGSRGAENQCGAARAAISTHFKRALHYSERQYLLKLYCMDTRLLVAIMGRQTSTLILNNCICCTVLKVQNCLKIVINSIPVNNAQISKCSSGKKTKKGNLLLPCCPRTVWAMRAVAPMAPAPLIDSASWTVSSP
jgi:hypothetical protein